MTRHPERRTPDALAGLRQELQSLEALGEARTREQSARRVALRSQIRAAETGPRASWGRVVEGTVVTLLHRSDGGMTTHVFAGRGPVDSERVLSPREPLGRAIDGRRAGETVTYESAGGVASVVEILAVTPY